MCYQQYTGRYLPPFYFWLLHTRRQIVNLKHGEVFFLMFLSRKRSTLAVEFRWGSLKNNHVYSEHFVYLDWREYILLWDVRDVRVLFLPWPESGPWHWRGRSTDGTHGSGVQASWGQAGTPGRTQLRPGGSSPHTYKPGDKRLTLIITEYYLLLKTWREVPVVTSVKNKADLSEILPL